MSIRVALHHITKYRYDRRVNLGPQTVRLRPAPHCRTPIEAYTLDVRPKEHFANWLQDPFGNHAARFVFPDPVTELSVQVDLIADLVVFNPFDFFLEPDAESYPFEYGPDLRQDLEPCLAKEDPGPLLAGYLKTFARSAAVTMDFLVAMNQRLAADISYTVRLEPGLQSCEDTLRLRSGSCRDSSWLLVQILRHLGLAARFASGYLVQLVPDVIPKDGPSGPTSDFCDLHAWAEVYLPGAGWVGLDPTSGLLAGEGHIPVACTPDPRAAAPISGAVSKCEVEFGHEMSVARLEDPSRPTKPYSEQTWAKIDALGHTVDRALLRGDVRLTMGGEPTFVSVDDMVSEQWNYDALGEDKARMGYDLATRLLERFAPGGVLQESQGKWYPGEPLPRWAFAMFWRKDGEPIWRDRSLLAGHGSSKDADGATARSFVEHLAISLGVDPGHALPAYEDALYYTWKEERLPRNIDVHDPRFKDESERRRLSRTLREGFENVTGYALPIDVRPGPDGDRWCSGSWAFRSGRLELLPGDSPMGLRLPLDAIDDEPVERRRIPVPQDPMEPRAPLPPAAIGPRPTKPEEAGSSAGVCRESDEGQFWTAVCVQPREGRLYIFLPPTRRLEHYLKLLDAIEETAAQLRCPVVIEGYEPPTDPRIDQLKVTPDPGVIEVNIHPSSTWGELSERTSTLYEEAANVRLGAEKFMVDGRHVGTGGGNHVILGGPTPADSPILRRPDLLRSLLGFWNNHPSLSYIFSGLFVGPTSQAPRVDESRPDAVSELNIAFKQIEPGLQPQPWVVDRVFRHLLTDLTGNTHRSEFCIDKLYSPDSATGRLGLLEFRGFEMPPHPRMNLAQQLLLRALVAAFWKHPYTQPLTDWGAMLYDRWALPEFIWADLADVCRDVSDRGYDIQPEWFRPHFDFRFPILGYTAKQQVGLTLRAAVEPWRVLGEEPAGGGVSRSVDSSLERIEAKATGVTPGRHRIACNGRALPLHPTGTDGEFVAGVRFRAWQPPRCLHPTIGVHTPLVFDIIDGWAAGGRGRSIGGCTYHVSHPGGRSYDHPPVNASEAEARRVSRFMTIGHTPGPMTDTQQAADPRAPMTLDLRR